MDININEVKEGNVLKILHARKGLVTVKAGEQDANSEWMNATVVGNTVKGMVNEWVEGERLPLRKTLIKKITKLENNEKVSA